MFKKLLSSIVDFFKGTVDTLSPVFSVPARELGSIEVKNVVTLSGDDLERFRRPQWYNEALEEYEAWERQQDIARRQQEYKEWVQNCRNVFRDRSTSVVV